jgi:outer membrane immunogenic protein
MKSGLLASVSIVALSFATGASAADLPVKARPMPVAAAPVYSWTGCYVGAHVGWGRGRHNHTHSQLTSFSGSPNVLSAASGRADSSGGLFGGQVGCNYQFASNWVVGIQGDVAGTDLNGKVQDAWEATFNDPDTRNFVGVKTDWLSSVTGRIGYTFYDNQGMLYAKGGGAWVHNIWDLHDTSVDFGAATASETRTGWTVGGGIEWKFTQNWSGFAEYNYYSFGGDKIIAVDTAGAAIRTFTSNKQEISTVKIGVNYMFTQAPIVARY